MNFIFNTLRNNGASILVAAVAILYLSACGPAVHSAMNTTMKAIPFDQEVIVFGLTDEIPEDAYVIGALKVGDSGVSTSCNYERVISEARLEARKQGGEAIKITSHGFPDFWSTCHRITADIIVFNSIN